MGGEASYKDQDRGAHIGVGTGERTATFPAASTPLAPYPRQLPVVICHLASLSGGSCDGAPFLRTSFFAELGDGERSRAFTCSP